MSELSVAGIGVIAFAAGLALLYKGIGKKLVAWLMLIAGAVISAGVVGRLVGRIAEGIIAGSSSAGRILFGATGTGLIAAVVIGICLWPHMKLKGKPPTKFTPWLALLFVPIVVATGGFLADIAAFGETTFGDIGTAALATLAEVARGVSQS